METPEWLKPALSFNKERSEQKKKSLWADEEEDEIQDKNQAEISCWLVFENDTDKRCRYRYHTWIENNEDKVVAELNQLYSVQANKHYLHAFNPITRQVIDKEGNSFEASTEKGYLERIREAQNVPRAFRVRYDEIFGKVVVQAKFLTENIYNHLQEEEELKEEADDSE